MSTVHRRRGRFLDELQPGDVFEHRPGRTVSEADNTFFTTLTMNVQSLHLDAAFAARTQFGQRLVNSLFTLATVVGLSVADVTEGTTIGNLGFDAISFPHPVFIGDTLYASTRVVSTRPSSSKPDRGIAVFEHIGTNQDGTVVCSATRTALMRRGPDAAAPRNPEETP